MTDPIDRAIQAVEQQPPAIMALTINLPSGRQAELKLPIPLTPNDVVQLMVAIADVVTGRISAQAQKIEGDSPEAIRSRLAARGLTLPG